MKTNKIIGILLSSFVILFLIIYIILITYSKIFVNSVYNPKFVSSEQERISGTINCDPSIGNLQQCSNPGDICIQCKDSAYGCQQVTSDNSNKYQLYDTNGNKLGFIPPGNWCLPVNVKSAKCNDFTSTPVLTKIDENNYMWRCYCKYPQWITSSGINEDCDIQIACDHQNNPENYLAYCPGGSSTCNSKDLIKWEPTSEVDLESTQCHCDVGSHYYTNPDYNVKTCLKDPCGDGGIWNSNFNDCVCNTGYINVNNLPDNHRAEYQGIGCIKDPCGDHGTFNYPTKDNPNYCKCENEDCSACNNGDCTDPNCTSYEFLSDKNYVTNGYCQKRNLVCDVNTNLTAQDCQNNGGICNPVYVNSGYSSTKIPIPQCYDCIPPYGFRNETDGTTGVNCIPALLQFVNCKEGQDQTCSTGRCHNSSFLGIDDGDICLPCNEPGDFIENMNSDDQHEKQNDYDQECADIDKTLPGQIGGRCNLYEFTDDNGYPLYPDYGKYLGFCQRDKCSDTNRGNLKCKRYD